MCIIRHSGHCDGSLNKDAVRMCIIRHSGHCDEFLKEDAVRILRLCCLCVGSAQCVYTN